MAAEEMSSPAEVYDQYYGPALMFPWAKTLLEHAQPSAGQQVLDLACGTGIVTDLISTEVGPNGRVVGLDFSVPMLEVARARQISGPAIEWVEADAASIPYPDSSFDLAICQHGFQFFPDAEACAAEVKRVLKPGGRLAMSVWADASEHPLYETMFHSISGRLGVPYEDVSKPFSFGGPTELKTLLSVVGFRDVRVVTKSQDASFTSPELWVQMTVQAAAAAIPAFAELSEDERRGLAPGVAEDVDELFRTHIQGSSVVIPTKAHIAVGKA